MSDRWERIKWRIEVFLAGRWFLKGLKWRWLCAFFQWLHYPKYEIQTYKYRQQGYHIVRVKITPVKRYTHKVVHVLGPNLFHVDGWSGLRSLSSPVWDKARWKNLGWRFITWASRGKLNKRNGRLTLWRKL